MADDLDPAAVERAARVLRMWLLGLGSLTLAQVDDLAPKMARSVVEAAAPTVEQVEQVAEVLAAHTVRGVKDGLWHCECGAYGPLKGDSAGPYMRHLARVLDGAGLLVTPEHDGAHPSDLPTTEDVRFAYVAEREVQTGILSAQHGRRFDAWLAEHDAQVAARALREWGQALAGRYPEDVFVEPDQNGWRFIALALARQDRTLDAVSASIMRRAARLAIEDADRIERQEGE